MNPLSFTLSFVSLLSRFLIVILWTFRKRCSASNCSSDPELIFSSRWSKPSCMFSSLSCSDSFLPDIHPQRHHLPSVPHPGLHQPPSPRPTAGGPCSRRSHEEWTSATAFLPTFRDDESLAFNYHKTQPIPSLCFMRWRHFPFACKYESKRFNLNQSSGALLISFFMKCLNV